LETYAEAKEPVDNPDFTDQKRSSLTGLTNTTIDSPILDIVRKMNELPHCFTLQCCFGHFVYTGQDNPHDLKPLPETNDIGRIEYRLAYIAFCVENNDAGRDLLRRYREIADADPEYVQFLSADWFWQRHVNSFAIQVMPVRFKDRDTAEISYEEALRVQAARDNMYRRLKEIVAV